MHIKNLLFLLFFLLLPEILPAQDSLYRRDYKSNSMKVLKKLSRSLESGDSDAEVANNYVRLAQELIAQGELQRGENYLMQAINLFTKNKQREDASSTYRELAKLQERQEKIKEAITNYRNAAQQARKKSAKELNLNDAARLENQNNPKKRSTLIQRNIDISNTVQNKEEAAISHRQMAQVKLDMDDKPGAIAEYEIALENVKEKPEEAIKIKQEMAQTYISDQNYEEAINLSETLITEAQKTSNPKIEIEQLKNLSEVYFTAEQPEQGILSLKKAYELALEKGETMQARDALQLLAGQYRKDKKTKDILALYADFIARLDTLISSDSTLIDSKTFQSHEARITQLENERALKDELIKRTRRLNYVLLATIFIVFLFVLVITGFLFSLSKKNKQIALQSLRREMNPHFIFNSLNSVNQFIAQNNELEANKYLTSYSKLMRNIMENSNKDFVSLATEIDQVRKYLELEYLRFRDKFSFDIYIAGSIDTDSVYIPNMLIQPQLENAIWHGLRYKEEGGGRLTLSISGDNRNIYIKVEDNGIGLRQSQELKTSHQKQHHSRGMTNTRERIHLLNRLYKIRITMRITDKQAPETGVIVELVFPFINRKHLMK